MRAHRTGHACTQDWAWVHTGNELRASHVQVTVKQHWNRPTTRRVKTFEKRATREKQLEMHHEIQKFRKQGSVGGA